MRDRRSSRPRNVMVVGMPRSGTSMVAAIFARRGYFVAEDPEEDLRGGDHHNPFGYWEAEGLARNLDRSSFRGRLATLLDHGYEKLPGGLRRFAKKITPRRLVRALFPERDM